jgi:hypothetical protein
MSAAGQGAERRGLMLAMAGTVPLAVLIWWAAYRLLPGGVAAAGAASPMRFALGGTVLAVLLCFLTGIEAVAHGRLFSAAINPLAGAESPALKVDLRYLQHTLEQLVLFIPSLFALAAWLEPESAVRAMAATILIWILSRYAFWIGYHRAPRWRALGLAGMMQSLLILLWAAWIFGNGIGGFWWGAAPVALFLGVEAVLVVLARR